MQLQSGRIWECLLLPLLLLALPVLALLSSQSPGPHVRAFHLLSQSHHLVQWRRRQKKKKKRRQHCGLEWQHCGLE